MNLKISYAMTMVKDIFYIAKNLRKIYAIYVKKIKININLIIRFFIQLKIKIII